mmetsp:Transcript_67600/g.198513  ORF Transcript_67600/g.198513 Transcript_67600/m.198513 type:complete len:328 (+) Transcript_67600:945-1928(+)
MPRVARERVEELRALRQVRDELTLEGHGSSQLHLLVEHLVSHALQLEPGEIPELRHLGLLEVLLDGRELPDVEAGLDHLLLVVLGERELRRRHEVHVDRAVEPEAVRLGVHGAAVEEVADEHEVDVRAVPSLGLKEAEFVEELLRRVLVPAIARVDEGRPREAALPAVVRHRLLQPRADALNLRADHKDGLADGVTAQHLDGVGDGFVLLERGRLGIKHVHLHAVELRSVAEGFLRARRVLHEDGVDGILGIAKPEGVEVLGILDGLLQLPRLLVEIPLLPQRQVVDDGHGAPLKWVLLLHVNGRDVDGHGGPTDLWPPPASRRRLS